jgi:hypothetical protein
MFRQEGRELSGKFDLEVAYFSNAIFGEIIHFN